MITQPNHAFQRKRRAVCRPNVFLAADAVVSDAAWLSFFIRRTRRTKRQINLCNEWRLQYLSEDET